MVFEWAIRYIEGDDETIRRRLDTLDLNEASELAAMMDKVEGDWEGMGSARTWLIEELVSLYPAVTRVVLENRLDFAASERVREEMRLRLLLEAALTLTSFDPELLPNVRSQVQRVRDRQVLGR